MTTFLVHHLCKLGKPWESKDIGNQKRDSFASGSRRKPHGLDGVASDAHEVVINANVIRIAIQNLGL
jgi:hypothetical protein